MIALRQLPELRKRLDEMVSALTPEQLFRVPPGFNNHIAWNAAHCVATQQVLHYLQSGIEPHLPVELLNKFRKGTGPQDGDEASYRQVMAFVHRGPELLAADYEAGRFAGFSPYVTSAGVRLDTIEEAIAFNTIHEGIHLGYILAQWRAVDAAAQAERSP